MSFAWLKAYMPRSLYGRAALILLLPILTILVVVSVVFIQRLYDGVTRQMTAGILLDVTYLVERVNEAQTLTGAQQALGPVVAALGFETHLPVTDAGADRRAFYDLSGRVVTDVLRAGLPGLRSVNLATESGRVNLVVDTAHGLMGISFPRGRVSASNPHQLLVLMAAISILMTIVAFLFLRNQLRPIKRMAQAAEAFGKGQIVPYRPSGATEMRQAGLAFLEMRNRIERLIEQRTLMLSGVSHDIRTPLTRLRLGLSMLQQSGEVKALEHDVDDMQKMLDEFLSFIRGDGPDEPEEANPAEILDRVLIQSERAGQPVRRGTVDGVSGVESMLRPMSVERALTNLIGNAVRYGRQVRVSLHCTDRWIRYTVEDDGPGIAPGRREEAMRPFTRLDQARNQNEGGGVGLGLSITADVARQHGGTLRLGVSESMGGLRADLILAR